MARVFLVLSLCLLASASAMNWNYATARYDGPSTTPANEANNDDSIVYHERDDVMNGQHVTLLLNDDSGDDADRESSLGVFRVIMDIVMKRAVSELRNQQNSDRFETTASVLNNEIDGGVDRPTSTEKPAEQSTTTPYTTTTTTTPSYTTPFAPPPRPPHSRCRWCECWERCRRRRYNWGICLCGKCHCYY